MFISDGIVISVCLQVEFTESLMIYYYYYYYYYYESRFQMKTK